LQKEAVMDRGNYPVELAIALLVLGGLIYIGKRVTAEDTAPPHKAVITQPAPAAPGGPGNTGARMPGE
jgi:hypothetical protein